MNCPWFVFKNIHSRDMSCVIEEDLHNMVPIENIETKEVRGRSGTLHKFLGTYAAFNYPITMQLLDFTRLEEVKRWLRGQGQLILSVDRDKYYEAVVINTGNPIKFENQLHTFWLFTVTFELQPLKRKVNEMEMSLKVGENTWLNDGTVLSSPKLTINTTGQGDIVILWAGINPDDTIHHFNLFTVMSPPKGTIVIDSELGVVTSVGGEHVKSKGKYPKISPGWNRIVLGGNEAVTGGELLQRSAYI